MLINLSKLIQLVKSIKDCPAGIPKRDTIIFEQFNEFEETCDTTVSVEVPVNLEKLRESNIDDEDVDKRKLAIKHLVSVYTDFQFPSYKNGVTLVSPLNTCDHCHSGTLIFTRPSRSSTGAVLFTRDGPRHAKVYIKHCTNCSATIHTSYTEFQENGFMMRKYVNCEMAGPYISFTRDTFFET